MPWSSETLYQTTISKKLKEIEAKEHKELLEDKYLLSIYSDASATSKGKGIGVGVAFYKGASLIAQEKVNIGYNQLVYNGELEGITLGLEKAIDLVDDCLEVRVYADNQAAILRLKTASDNPGQEWQLRCIRAAKKLKKKGLTPAIHWVPGHQDIIGNEKADALAKEATKLDPSSSRTSLAVIGTRIKQLGEREWLSYLEQYRRKAIALNSTTYAARYK
jgi:ribonuclease HI